MEGDSGGHQTESSDGLASVRAALERAAAESPAVRAAMREVAALLQRIAVEPESPARAESGDAAAQAEEDAAPKVHIPLRLGDAQATVPVRQTDEAGVPSFIPWLDEPQPVGARPATPAPAAPTAPADLGFVIRRTLLKAECCEWASERRRRLADRADFETSIKPRDVELRAKAKALPDCNVWPLDPYVALPSDELLETASTCYQNLARAAEFATDTRAAEADVDTLARAYALLAEAQSAVRALMRELDLREDHDQNEAFRWLRVRTDEDQVFIARHMKLNDPADPRNAADLETSIEQARDEWDSRRRSEERQTRLMNRARYHARKIAAHDGSEIDDSDWQRLYETVIDLVEGGLPPSNVALRELLLPIIDTAPETLGRDARFERVLAEIDRYMASREVDRPPAAPEVIEESVLRVRALLRGRVVVLIGGERRGETADRLARIFELAELRWISTREHESVSRFQSDIMRPETALVLLAIRWSSHSYEEVADMCALYDKAFVRLPGGYGANQIAHQVLQQASASLAALPPVT